MLLRLPAAAAIAVLAFLSVDRAEAQFYPSAPNYPPPGVAYDPAPYSLAPPAEGQNAQPIISSPYPQAATPGGQPGQPGQPGIQRSEAVPGDGAPPRPPVDINNPGQQPVTTPGQPSIMSVLPPEDQPEVGEPKELPPQLKRQLVDFTTREPAGTIIIDTANTHLYFILGNGKAIRYGIGVGREGFTWSGTERISKMAEWPDWYPPQEMIERQPYLPRFMAGGESNPLGARSLYLGKTLFRIHGTNQPSTIGQFVSSGCVRLLNADIADLYDRVKVGTRVVVLPGSPPATAQAAPAAITDATLNAVSSH